MSSQLSHAVQYLTGAKPLEDYTPVMRDGVWTIENWTHANPQPTDAEINAVLLDPGFAADWNENGGDPTLTARRIAKEATSTPAGKLLVALVSAMAKNGVFGAATKQQIVSSVLAEIDLGEAD